MSWCIGYQPDKCRGCALAKSMGFDPKKNWGPHKHRYLHIKKRATPAAQPQETKEVKP